MNEPPILELSQVTFGYRPEGPLLREVDLRLQPGELVGLIGANGAGKSTLFRLCGGLLRPQSGVVRLLGRPLAGWRERERAAVQALLPQQVTAALPFTVREIVRLGRIAHLGALNWWRREDEAAVAAAMAEMALEAAAERPFDALSGGERQRVLLAAALAQQPRLLLLDEPTSALDLGSKLRLMRHLRRLAAERGMTVAVIGHDLELLGRFLPRLVLLHRGRVLADGTPQQVITSERIRTAYGCEVTVRPGADGAPLLEFERD